MMSHGGPVVVTSNPHEEARETFKNLASRIARARASFESLRKIVDETNKVITAKELAFALKQATQYCHGDMVTYFLEQCGEQISFEDILTAFELAIMTDNKKVTAPFSKHLASRQSPRTGNDKKEHIDTIKALNLANGDLALLADKDLTPFALCKALSVAGMAGNGRVFKPILEHARTKEKDKVFAFKKAVESGQTHIVKMILQNYPGMSGVDLELALESACESSHIPIVEVIFEHNAEAISAGSFGSALGKILESERVNIDLLKIILERGAKKIPQNIMEDATNLAALRGANIFKIVLPFNTALSETQRNLWLFAITDDVKFKSLVQNPALDAKDRTFALQKAALATKSHLVKSTLLTSLSKKEEIDPVILGKILRKACKRINAANFEVIQALYEACKQAIPLKSVQKALIRMIDSDRYHHETFTYLVKSHDKALPLSFLEEAISKSVMKGRTNALDVLLSINNMSPLQKKAAIVAAFQAQKQELFYDSRFSMMDRIRAIGLGLYLLKVGEDIKTTRPWLSGFSLFVGRLITAITKTWEEPKPVKITPTPPVQTVLPPATLSPRESAKKEEVVVFSPSLKPTKSALRKAVGGEEDSNQKRRKTGFKLELRQG